MNNTIYGGTTVTPIPLVVTDRLAPAISGTAQGQTVVLDDISPIEHELKVKLSAPPKVEEVETSIPVDISKLKNYDGELIGTDLINVGANSQCPVITTLREMCGDRLSVGDIIFIKVKCYSEHNLGLNINLNDMAPDYMDSSNFSEYWSAPSLYTGDYGTDGINAWSEGETEGVSRQFVVNEYILNSWFFFSVDAPDNSFPAMSVTNIEIIKIGYETTYPDYTKITLTANSDTYTPQEDGTVLGVRSQYPTLTLSAHSEEVEDITITCEYNKDTNKVLGDLGGGGSWQKIVDVTTAQPVNGIIATAEEYPNLAKCKEFIIRFILPKVSSSFSLGTLRMELDANICYYASSISASTSAICEAKCYVFITDGLINSISNDKPSGQAAIVGSIKNLIGDRFLTKDLDKFRCFLGDSTKLLPVGTKLIIYGKVAI